MTNTKYINCYKCKYYYVTWDENFPHGCKGMNFKTREYPSSTVLRTSGKPCLLFKAKKIKKSPNNK